MGIDLMMEKENILDGRQEEKFYYGKEKERAKGLSDLVFDKGIECWRVCAVSFLIQFLSDGQANSFGAVMLVSCDMPPFQRV